MEVEAVEVVEIGEEEETKIHGTMTAIGDSENVNMTAMTMKETQVDTGEVEIEEAEKTTGLPEVVGVIGERRKPGMPTSIREVTTGGAIEVEGTMAETHIEMTTMTIHGTQEEAALVAEVPGIELITSVIGSVKM